MLIGIRWRCSAADTVLGNSCPYMAGERSPNLPIYLVMNILNAGLDVRTWVPTAHCPLPSLPWPILEPLYECECTNIRSWIIIALRSPVSLTCRVPKIPQSKTRRWIVISTPRNFGILHLLPLGHTSPPTYNDLDAGGWDLNENVAYRYVHLQQRDHNHQQALDVVHWLLIHNFASAVDSSGSHSTCESCPGIKVSSTTSQIPSTEDIVRIY